MHIQNFRQQNVDLVNFWLHFVMQTRTLGKLIINGNSKLLKIINKMCSVGENFYQGTMGISGSEKRINKEG